MNVCVEMKSERVSQAEMMMMIQQTTYNSIWIFRVLLEYEIISDYLLCF